MAYRPRILPLFDSGAADGFLYYVMPFVEGESLREKLDRERQLDVREFPSLAGRWQISRDPVVGRAFWVDDGAALAYLRASDGALVRADVERTPTVRVTGHQVIASGGPPITLAGVHPDGQRLLVYLPFAAEAFGGEEGGVVVVANWFSELLERTGGG